MYDKQPKQVCKRTVLKTVFSVFAYFLLIRPQFPHKYIKVSTSLKIHWSNFQRIYIAAGGCGWERVGPSVSHLWWWRHPLTALQHRQGSDCTGSMPCRGPADTRQRALAPDLQRSTHQRRFIPTAPRSPVGQLPTKWRLGVGKPQTAGPRWDSPVIAAWNVSAVASGGAAEEIPPLWSSGALKHVPWSSGAVGPRGAAGLAAAAWKQLDSVFTFTLLAAGTSGESLCSAPNPGGRSSKVSREEWGRWWMVKVGGPLSCGDGDEPGDHQNWWHEIDAMMEACLEQRPKQNNSNNNVFISVLIFI